MTKRVFYLSNRQVGSRWHELDAWLNRYCPGHNLMPGYMNTYIRLELYDEQHSTLFSLAWGDVVTKKPVPETWMTPRP